MSQKTKLKIFYFVVVLALYFFIVGADINRALLKRGPLGWVTNTYVIATVIAFWCGRESFGIYQKINPRPFAILIGGIVMVTMFILMLLLKEALHHYDNHTVPQ